MKPVLQAVIVVACGLGMLGCSKQPRQAPPVTAQQEAKASKAMGLAFPAGMKSLAYYEESGGPDDAIFLKIEMTADDLGRFLQQSPLAGASWETKMHMLTDTAEYPGWNPEKVRKFRFRQFSLPNAEVLNVLIDDANEQTKVIYLMWHQT